MFGFLCNVSLALTLLTSGCPWMAAAAFAGGLVWLIDTDDDGSDL